MKRHIISFGWMVSLSIVFFWLMCSVVGSFVLAPRVVPPAGVRLEEWLANYTFWVGIVTGASLLAAVVWYLLGQWAFKLKDWRGADRRYAWSLLLLAPSAAAVLAIILTVRAQEGFWLAYMFYAVEAVLLYYLITAPCSPSSYKYTPVWSDKWRCW